MSNIQLSERHGGQQFHVLSYSYTVEKKHAGVYQVEEELSVPSVASQQQQQQEKTKSNPAGMGCVPDAFFN